MKSSGKGWWMIWEVSTLANLSVKLLLLFVMPNLDRRTYKQQFRLLLSFLNWDFKCIYYLCFSSFSILLLEILFQKFIRDYTYNVLVWLSFRKWFQNCWLMLLHLWICLRTIWLLSDCTFVELHKLHLILYLWVPKCWSRLSDLI